MKKLNIIYTLAIIADIICIIAWVGTFKTGNVDVRSILTMLVSIISAMSVVIGLLFDELEDKKK